MKYSTEVRNVKNVCVTHTYSSISFARDMNFQAPGFKVKIERISKRHHAFTALSFEDLGITVLYEDALLMI